MPSSLLRSLQLCDAQIIPALHHISAAMHVSTSLADYSTTEEGCFAAK
jgi:hypothetical protein